MKKTADYTMNGIRCERENVAMMIKCQMEHSERRTNDVE